MANVTRKLMKLIKESAQELPVEQMFFNDLEKVCAIENPPRVSSTHYKPSSMNCARLMFFDKIQATKDNKVAEWSGVRIGECGTDSHLRIQGYVSKMKQHGIDCEWVDIATYIKENNLDYLIIREKDGFETKLYDKRYDLSFKCDGLIKYLGVYYILEIKTEISGNHSVRTDPNAKHINQASCYSLSLGIDKILWVYENRDICTLKIFISVISNEEKEEVMSLIEYVDNCVKEGIPPDKTLDRRTCAYCSYTKECRKH